jgi:thioredoxin 1
MSKNKEQTSQKNKSKTMSSKKKKKVLAAAALSAFIIGVVLGVISYKSEQSSKAQELYQTTDLHPATKNILNDPNYQNIILPEELDQKIEQKEELYVYFFSPLCKYCEQSKNDITKAFKDENTELYQLNLLEYEEGYQKYNVRGTPAIFHYKDGKVADMIYGGRPLEEYSRWIEETKNR